MDGKPVGRTPLGDPLTVGKGAHMVVVSKSGFHSSEQSVELAAGEGKTVTLDLVPTSGRQGEAGSEPVAGERKKRRLTPLFWSGLAGIEVRFLVEVNPRKIGKKIHAVPVVRAEKLRELEDPGLILGAVGQKGARDSIRASLEPLGMAEGRDYIFVA